jgi:hypothetical protein
VLVVRGGERVHRLAAVPERLSGSPNVAGRWCAAFAWQDAPEAFESAELEFGADLVVELPEPRPKVKRRGDQVLEVRRTREQDGQAPRAAERLALEAALLVAQEEARELRAGLDRAHAELARAREDLETERKGRAEDSGRFRDGLERVRESAEEEVARVAGDAGLRRAEIGAARAEAERLLARLEDLENALEERGQP